MGPTVSMGEMRNVYTILVGKSGMKTLRGIPRSTGNVRIHFVKWSARLLVSFICLIMGNNCEFL